MSPKERALGKVRYRWAGPWVLSDGRGDVSSSRGVFLLSIGVLHVMQVIARRNKTP